MLPDLTQYLWIAWIVLALVFIIIELVTLEFTFLMLAAGSLIGGLGVELLGGPWWLQIALAAALSALLLFTIRPLLLKVLHRGQKPELTNVDALSGMAARVLAPFIDGFGSVKLANGETWTAQADDHSAATFEVGTRVRVVAVHGATVEVAPAVTAPPSERNSDDG
ncbi:NfeD family protein [Planococcus sp. APC 4015]|nr:NfeD family protein [Planococcus sp. APC 4015]